ncbi:hypothetical protein [Leptospira wolffii]|uniref:hypothetical protein n=1 Tax=Leptospira wolffii TaxID=409998 RepID=UPI0003122728|nr:hypothetical protein [Leptospira wolffii]EPG64456.1 hypothetical protein LEP1GSC061_3831 [Leptospira wolffii serovar Khorat str. Khorat-H2]
MKQKLLITSLLAIALGLFGNCGGAGSSDSSALALAGLGGGGGGVKVATAADLAVESADNYDDNKFGLISAGTLRNWIDDWANNKPAGITGDLVIFQANKVGSGKTIIKPTTGVRVYVSVANNAGPGDPVPTYSWKTFRENRNNGLISITNSYGIISGPSIDSWFQWYGVDPTKDLIVFASGTGDNYGSIGHQHYALRYWGVSHEHLAILNGTIKGQFDETNELGLDADESIPPQNGTFSVKQLKNVDNRILTLSIEDTIQVVKNNGHHGLAGLSSTVYISDNRTKATIDANPDGYTATAGWQEYDGGENTTGSTLSGASPVAFEGHLKGAVFVPHWNLIDRTSLDSSKDYTGTSSPFNTLKFRPKSYVKALWDDYSVGINPADGTTPYSSTNNPNIGATAYQEGQTILQYCRTNTRTQTSGISTNLILGRPTVFLEDGWSIFGLLAGNFPGANFDNEGDAAATFPSVPAKFAPDLQGVVESGARGSGSGPHYNGSGATKVKKTTVASYSINSTATTTKQAFIDDWNYKNQ